MRPAYIFLLISLCALLSCKKDKVAPLSERIAKVWSAQKVTEASTVVYTKGASSNAKPGYSQFRLDLSSATSVRLTEFDGNTFVGQWEVSADEKTLTLKNLNPQPTGTGGMIVYNIVEGSDSSLKLTRTTASAKTGNTLNSYELTNQ
jgi:hypothetical protein